jgi:hypothetical protein
VVEDITPMLTAAGCYERRDAAIRTVLPEYGEGWKAKIVLPSLLGGSNYSLFSVVAESPEGERREAHLTAEAYREVVAATNFKQRVRRCSSTTTRTGSTTRSWARRTGSSATTGFFVKNGDGSADVKPVAHLYKTQVRASGGRPRTSMPRRSWSHRSTSSTSRSRGGRPGGCPQFPGNQPANACPQSREQGFAQDERWVIV